MNGRQLLVKRENKDRNWWKSRCWFRKWAKIWRD